ncbi:unnamed protein product [Lactuca saligna]|uniref:Protein kinase domain-containing protein n=1 Tax=Lactuca saligna TaxID=75948 RepID=A0AA35ZJS8_LACSI|nr:unnamed protein product [Lactuca saligna]
MEDTQDQTSQTQPCRQFSLSEIQIATHRFDEESVIGQGGYGKVYKGSIKIGETYVLVAMKRLHSNSNQGALEFWAEVEMLSKLRHCNLASLIGYCKDANEMILVYEYMPKGTLEDCLRKGATLSWLLRLNICIGAARGLDYLHTGTGTKQAILGWRKWAPPILLLPQESKGHSEVLCGRPAVDTTLKEEQWGLAKWAQERITKGKLSKIIDSRLRRRISSNCLKEFAKIAVRCLHTDANKRPTMAEVVAKLELALSLQKKVDPSAAKGRVRKKALSFFKADVPKLINSITSYLAIRKPVVLATSIVDADYESGGHMVHFDGGFELSLIELLTASAKILNEKPYCRTYVAYLSDGSQVVVKRILTQLSQNNFATAVSALGKIRHMNVLDVKAYYWGRGETLCVFKFMINGSVASLLKSSRIKHGSITPFEWPQRINIIMGITRGLLYLHTQEKIIHGDLKLSMILLDEDYNPVIANVGLSQLMPATRKRVRNNCAPEFSGSVNATAEVDIYSLGIIMLQLLSRESAKRRKSSVDLPTWVRSVPKENWSAKVFDEKLIQETSFNGNSLVMIMELALQCVEYDPKDRPTANDVIQALEQIQV